jgi:uncharacterized protein
MADSLLILGASARAAAQSAARAGIRPICGDLFCDADLPEGVVGQVARSFPRDLVRIAEQAPPAPWMYTGGLENHPRAVERISCRHMLLGTAANSLRRVRNPVEVGRVLSDAGLLFPECRPTSDGLPMDGTWLRKNRGSSGGLRVQLWHGQRRPVDDRGWYYQRRVIGAARSAVYLAASGQARLIGTTEQILTGDGPLPFRYASSIGPIELSPRVHEYLAAIGELLVGRFDLRGLFGVDLVIDGDDIWTIEVNPRYTASVEVLERALGFNAVALHIAACHDSRLPDVDLQTVGHLCGKLIVCARHGTLVSSEMTAAITYQNRGCAWPLVADIPRSGTRLLSGHPALTVFAEGKQPSEVRGKLQSLANALRERFGC